MSDAPEKKKRKLTTALREAIGAHAQKTEENIEKPIALALISDNKSAQDLLNKIQASRRPQAVLEATLKICQEKKTEAHVEDAFLSIFQKHFSVLGIDSATTCWKLLVENLNKSESLNEIIIVCEFIGTANLLGHGFGKLLQTIKAETPPVIVKAWKNNRKTDAMTLSYSLVSLILAEHTYGDGQIEQKPSEYWTSQVLVEKTMKKDFGMQMISSLAGIDQNIGDLTEVSEDQLLLLSNIFLNHLEFFISLLNEENSEQLLVKVIEEHLKKNELKKLVERIHSVEISVTPRVYNALILVIQKEFSLSDSEVISIENLEQLKLKEVTKVLPTITELKASKKSLNTKSIQKLNSLLDFVEMMVDGCEDNRDSAAFSLIALNLLVIFNEVSEEVFEQILRKNTKEVVDKLAKAGKGLEEKGVKQLKKVKNEKEEEIAPKKFVNRTAPEAIESFEASDVSVSDAISILQSVHTAEAKKELFDTVVKYMEELPGGESLEELKLFRIVVEMYGGGPLESLALQIVFSRLAADGWTEMDRTPGTDQSEESWFAVLVEMIDLLDTTVKAAKNSVLKSFTALFCQLFSQLLKNTQKFARNSLNAALSKTLSPEATKKCVLRRHKLIQDVARLVDGMKRNESYFAMLTASIIGDAVFYGSDSLLAMSKLHSLADKNASALLATNLPVVERTRYKKYLSTITRASKRVY